MARPKSALLSRKLIGQAAIELVDAGHELQVVPLAERLGVSVSSLYHHVKGRTGIIHAMREVLSEQHSLAPTPGADWETTIRSSMRTLWNLYGSHPRVMPLLLTVVIDEPDTVDFYAAMIAALEEVGVPEDQQLSTVEALEAFAFGVALDALSPEFIFAPDERHTRLNHLIAHHPTGARRNEMLFEHGLDLLILGIRERARLAKS